MKELINFSKEYIEERSKLFTEIIEPGLNSKLVDLILSEKFNKPPIVLELRDVNSDYYYSRYHFYKVEIFFYISSIQLKYHGRLHFQYSKKAGIIKVEKDKSMNPIVLAHLFYDDKCNISKPIVEFYWKYWNKLWSIFKKEKGSLDYKVLGDLIVKSTGIDKRKVFRVRNYSPDKCKISNRSEISSIIPRLMMGEYVRFNIGKNILALSLFDLDEFCNNLYSLYM